MLFWYFFFWRTVTRDEPEGMHGAERVNEMSMDDADAPKRNRRVGKLRSKTWDHFTVLKYTDDRRPLEANCNYCDELFSCDTKKNGLSTMSSHIKKICKKKPAGALPPNPSRYQTWISQFLGILLYNCLRSSPSCF
jgi:hypothetical protein